MVLLDQGLQKGRNFSLAVELHERHVVGCEHAYQTAVSGRRSVRRDRLGEYELAAFNLAD